MSSYRISSIIISVIFAFGLIQIGSSLKCFNCNGLNDCKNNATNTEETCKNGADLCVQISDKKADVAIRRCGVKDDCLIYTFCSECDSDLCNSSPKALPTFLTLSVCALTVFKYII